MKRSSFRFVTSRSFTKLLSILTLAALELLAVQQAFAGIVCCTNSSFTDCTCDASLVCNISANGKFYGTQVPGRTCWITSTFGSSSSIKSTITCENVPGTGSATTTLGSTSFQQNALLSCKVEDSSIPTHDGTGFCQLDLSYSRPAGLTTCLNNNNTNPPTSTLTYAALCQDASGGNANSRLTVAGTLRCPVTLPNGTLLNNVLPNWCKNVDETPNNACILNLGIADTQGKCTTLFPPDGTVLSYSQTVEGSGCSTLSDVTALDTAQTGYCTGATFNGAPVDCNPKQPTPFTGTGTAENAVQFDVTFAPTTLNVTCNNPPQNNDVWRFTIVGNQHLDPNLINVSTLNVEGFGGDCDENSTGCTCTAQPSAPSICKCTGPGCVCKGANCVTCGTVVNNQLACQIPDCPGLAPFVAAERDPVTLEVNLTVKGFLNSNSVPPITAIVGEDLAQKTSGH